MKIAFVFYDQLTALDLAGPYEVIARWPGAEVHFVAAGPDPVRADAGLVVLPTATLGSLTAPDLVVVPGSGNPMPALTDKALLAWVQHVSQYATWMASVCTGVKAKLDWILQAPTYRNGLRLMATHYQQP